MVEEIKRLVDKLGGTISAADRLGVSRQTIWELTSGKDRGTRRVYLYALRYLFLMPALRRTKTYREYVNSNPDKSPDTDEKASL